MRPFPSIKRRPACVTAVCAAVALAFAASAATAAEREKPRKKAYKERQTERIYSQADENGWYPQDARLLKFGSRIWWEQMEREGRTGRRDW